jgi:hypothetical protein
VLNNLRKGGCYGQEIDEFFEVWRDDEDMNKIHKTIQLLTK